MTEKEWAEYVAESERQDSELQKAKYRREAWGDLVGLIPHLPYVGVWIIVLIILI